MRIFRGSEFEARQCSTGFEGLAESVVIHNSRAFGVSDELPPSPRASSARARRHVRRVLDQLTADPDREIIGRMVVQFELVVADVHMNGREEKPVPGNEPVTPHLVGAYELVGLEREPP